MGKGEKLESGVREGVRERKREIFTINFMNFLRETQNSDANFAKFIDASFRF